MMNRIYLDYAATTPVSETVLEAMLPFFSECWGNASGVYGTGREARRAVERARKQVAAAIGAEPAEICFTSGGSESDNQAIRGTARALRNRGKHVITTEMEHHAVLHSCKRLEEEGFEVTYLRPDRNGRVDLKTVRDAIREDTILISVMAANNEIGTLEPIREIGETARERGIVFHTDAVQAVGAVPIDVKEWRVDLLSLSAHKFYGPKGVGALYIREGTVLPPLICGGSQERGLRAGTENLPGIVGLGAAITEATEHLAENAERMRRMRDRLIHGVLNRIPGSRLNGSPDHRLPNNANFVFEGVNAETLLLRLDLAGIAVSAGSACTSGSVESSHVLKAIGLSEEDARSSVRMTTGVKTTEEETEEVLRILSALIAEQREISGYSPGN